MVYRSLELTHDLMELAHTLAVATIRKSLATHRQEEQQLRDLIATSPSSTVRMLAGIDLVDVSKKIEAEEAEIKQFEAE